jgi:hypothetical protein
MRRKIKRKRRIKVRTKSPRKKDDKINYPEVFGLTAFGIAFILGTWGILASMVGYYWFSVLSIMFAAIAYTLRDQISGEIRLWIGYLVAAALISAATGITLSMLIQVPV